MLLTSEATQNRLKGSNKALVCVYCFCLPGLSRLGSCRVGMYHSASSAQRRKHVHTRSWFTPTNSQSPRHHCPAWSGAAFSADLPWGVLQCLSPTQVCYMYSQLLHQAQTREKASRGNRCLLLGGGCGGDGLGHLEVQALSRAGRENNNVRGRCWLLCNWPTPWHKP